MTKNFRTQRSSNRLTSFRCRRRGVKFRTMTVVFLKKVRGFSVRRITPANLFLRRRRTPLLKWSSSVRNFRTIRRLMVCWGQVKLLRCQPRFRKRGRFVKPLLFSFQSGFVTPLGRRLILSWGTRRPLMKPTARLGLLRKPLIW